MNKKQLESLLRAAYIAGIYSERAKAVGDDPEKATANLSVDGTEVWFEVRRTINLGGQPLNVDSPSLIKKVRNNWVQA